MQSEDELLGEPLRRFEYTCPSCGDVLPDFAEQCPHCGHDLLDSFSGTFRPRHTLLTKVIAVVVLLLLAGTLAAVLIALAR